MPAAAAQTTVDRIDSPSGDARGVFGPRVFVTPNNLGTDDYPLQATDPNISGDGSVIVYASERSDLEVPDRVGWDVFYEVNGHRRTPYDIARMRKGEGWYEALWPNVSRNGQVILFVTDSPNLVPGDGNRVDDLLAFDRKTGTVQRVNVAQDGHEATVRYHQELTDAAISADGRYVAFTSTDALVPQDTNGFPDVYVRDLVAHTTTLVSATPTGQAGRDWSGADSGRLGMSGDGRFVTYTSFASNLVRGDDNHAEDVFITNMRTGTTELVTVADDGTQLGRNPRLGGVTGSRNSSVSDDGRYVAFESNGLGLDGLTRQPGTDVYLRDRVRHTTRLLSRNERGTPSGDEPQHGSAADRISPDGRYEPPRDVRRLQTLGRLESCQGTRRRGTRLS